MLCSHPFFKSSANMSKADAFSSHASIPFPCGQCLHCRINQARVWTHRLLLENSVSNDSVFATLTYHPDYLPEGGNLHMPDYQKYLKRIRKYHNDSKIRFFGVGEYGSTSYRPHYHIALFSDKMLNRLALESYWFKGFSYFGDISKDSAKYIVGYCVKKLTDRKDERLHGLNKEFMTCSKQDGGLGLKAIKKIAKQLKQSGFYNGHTIRSFLSSKQKNMPLGRYLLKKLAEELGTDSKQLIKEYYSYADEFVENFYPEDSSNFSQYMLNILESSYGKRKSREKKQKIFQQDKTL